MSKCDRDGPFGDRQLSVASGTMQIEVLFRAASQACHSGLEWAEPLIAGQTLRAAIARPPPTPRRSPAGFVHFSPVITVTFADSDAPARARRAEASRSEPGCHRGGDERERHETAEMERDASMANSSQMHARRQYDVVHNHCEPRMRGWRHESVEASHEVGATRGSEHALRTQNGAVPRYRCERPPPRDRGSRGEIPC